MSFNSLFNSATRLPSIPKIIEELIESLDDPNADIDKISAKIAQEPVLTTKLLRVANSAHYGLPRQVSSVQDAAIIMGFPAVRTLVMASGMVDSLEMPAALNKRSFWINAFEVAGCAKWLCKFQKELDANTAFTAGLIHSVGQLLMYSAEPAKANEVQAKVANGQERLAAELEIFGFNNCEAGSELAKRWKFPDVINTGLRFQNNPKKATPASVTAALIYLAKHVVDMLKDHPSKDEILTSLPSEIKDNPPVDLNAMVSALDAVDDFSGGIGLLLD
ncbi:HDOD domain-containing protein [Marinagarivorans algicola]|uniref:HDOD domain-containing protein n=1 Tax=Marinagarivorans algicola TaxID=1513270 RepID=UPI0006B4721D|nr:HDOD domain-containing protein [Marinagarivorans algicola]